MNYPLISEYVEAIKMAEDNLDQLSHLRPVLDNDGRPVMSSGNFAVVFKMKDERNGKFHALKCFIKDQEGRDEAYKLIADELEFVSSEFIIPIKFFEKELFVDTSNSDETEFPVLLMDWIEGLTLDKYVRRHLQDQYALQLVSYQFCRVAAWLMVQPFAHGDLKPDNILVKDDGSLILVDYDGMFVPAMNGQKAREAGSPDYRHPARTINDFNEHIDDFSLATIAMQLYAISLQPELLQTSPEDTLLLCEKDYRDLGESEIMTKLFSQVGNPEFEKLLSIFLLAHSEMFLSFLSFRAFNISKPVKLDVLPINLSTEVTDEDIANGVKDEYGVVYSKDGKRLLKELNIPSSYNIRPGTRIICDEAFQMCCNITNINIPDSVTHIGNRAFLACGGLTSITIPNSITHIGDEAFYGCRSLTSIIIPNSVIHIGEGAFAYCPNLKSIQVSRFNNYYDSRENCNAIIHTATNKLVTGCNNTIIPNSIANIGKRALSGCYHMTSINIPDSVTHIGENAFSGCGNLINIQVSGFNKVFDSRENCNAIIHTATNTLVRGCCNTFIPNSVTCISVDAFDSSSGMASINIPDSVTHIGDRAFSCCSGLTSINIPHSVKFIGDKAFSFCSRLTSINIPSTVTYIGDETFFQCMNLANINIPDSVTYIGNSAFRECYSLTSIKIPHSVTQMGETVFGECKCLTSINILSRDIIIGKHAFAECKELTSIIIPNGSIKRFQAQLNDYSDKLIEQDDWLCSPSTEVTKEDLDNGVIDQYGVVYSKDGRRLLKANRNIQSYQIQSQTQVICNNAFRLCQSLSSIKIPNAVNHIGKGAFQYCSSLTSINIPKAITHIREGAFEGCGNLLSITIPETVTHIGKGAFYLCSGLTRINIPNSVIYLGDKAFCYCESLTSIKIPNTVTHIGSGAFYNCSSLTSITIPNHVLTIGYSTYRGCAKLTSIAIPNSVICIGEEAFRGCSGLTSIIVPASVTSIGRWAFRGCSGLNRITIQNSNMKLNGGALAFCESLTSIYIPKGSREHYKKQLMPSFESKLIEI